jgi:hypothetical protein
LDSRGKPNILTDNILLSTIEKIATSYHTQSNFLPKQKIAVAISHFLKLQAQAAINTLILMLLQSIILKTMAHPQALKRF